MIGFVCQYWFHRFIKHPSGSTSVLWSITSTELLRTSPYSRAPTCFGHFLLGQYFLRLSRKILCVCLRRSLVLISSYYTCGNNLCAGWGNRPNYYSYERTSIYRRARISRINTGALGTLHWFQSCFCFCPGPFLRSPSGYLWSATSSYNWGVAQKIDLVITLEVNASELHFGLFFRGTRLNHVWPIWLTFLAEYGRVEYSWKQLEKTDRNNS